MATFSAGGITHIGCALNTYIPWNHSSILHSSGVGGVTVAYVGWGAMVASTREGCALHGEEEEQHSA